MKKLIPAIVLLLVSALLMATASYAWFSINTTVTATNMKVEATTSKNLVISVDDTDYYQSVDSDSTAMDEMYPVSTSDFSSWFTTTEQGTAKIDYNEGGLLSGLSFASGDFKAAVNGVEDAELFTRDYYYTDTFYIKVAGVEGVDEFTSLYVSDITVSANLLDISEALRVGVKVGSTLYIYSPNGGDTSYNAITSTSGGTTAVTAYNAYANTNSLGGVDTDGITATVYIWYEGADTNCTSYNAIDSEQLTVSISFKAE